MAQLRDTAIDGNLRVLGEATLDNPLSIKDGGTGGTNIIEAKAKLGITYGDEVPMEAPETGDGTIYFFEDEDTPVAIIEGGTGARTVGGALDNFGIADYIVEQGTEGIWTWRKWNSGIAECWGVHEGTYSNYTTCFGGYGYKTDVINYPTNLFAEIPHQFASVRIGSGFGIYGSDVNTSTATGTTIYAIGSGSGSSTITAKIHAIGRWK